MTLPNFTEYVPPGVYWQQSATPISPQSTGLPNGVAIVGPGIGYRTFSEAITLTGTDPVALSKEGVDGSSIIVSANGNVIKARDGHDVAGQRLANFHHAEALVAHERGNLAVCARAVNLHLRHGLAFLH